MRAVSVCFPWELHSIRFGFWFLKVGVIMVSR